MESSGEIGEIIAAINDMIENEFAKQLDVKRHSYIQINSGGDGDVLLNGQAMIFRETTV